MCMTPQVPVDRPFLQVMALMSTANQYSHLRGLWLEVSETEAVWNDARTYRWVVPATPSVSLTQTHNVTRRHRNAWTLQ